MLNAEFAHNRNEKIKILCLGAHCDDIEIGCGGTILTLLQGFPRAEVDWVVFSSDSARGREARSSAKIFLKGANRTSVHINKFRNGFFPYCGAAIKDYFEELKKTCAPDVVFTHYGQDRHQDHRTIAELTWNTFREHLILEYEIPKYDGDFGTPNFFVPLDFQTCRYKAGKILSSFKSQSGKRWFTEDLFLSTLRIRGMECCSPTRYAEAFYSRKIVFSP